MPWYLCRGLAIVCVAAAAACNRPDPDEHYLKAKQFLAESKLREAVIESRAALQADGKRGDIRMTLADTLMELGERRAALGEYLRAADALPDQALPHLRAGNLLLATGKFEDAETYARRVLAIDANSAEGQVLLGNALAGLQQVDAALAEYQEAIALDPASEGAYLNMGAVQLATGQLAKAEETFKKAIEMAPKSAAPRIALANFYWSTRRVADAEAGFKDALTIDPTDATANRVLGSFYIATGRPNDAEQYFQAIARNAKTTEARIALADYYGAFKRFKEATEVLKGLTARQDDAYPLAMTRLAAIDAAQGFRAEALSKTREVLAAYPKDGGARLLTARLLLDEGKREEALAEAKLLVTQEAEPSIEGAAYLLIGGIHASMDRREDAIAAYQEARNRQRRPMAATIALASLHFNAGELDKASTFIDEALTIQPRDAVARTLSVRVMLARGNHAAARERLESLQRDYPNSPLVLNVLGASQLAVRNIEAARRAYSRAAQLAPNDLEAVTGLVQADLATGRTADAVARVEKLLAATKPTTAFLILAAKTYLAGGHAAKAEQTLTAAIETDPNQLQVYGLLGQLYLGQNRLDSAADQYGAIVARNPGSVPAMTMLGMLREAQGRLPEAEQLYKDALAVDPTAAVAANNLAWLYVAGNRNLDDALKLAQEARKALPEEPAVNDTLGWIYYQLGMNDVAITHLSSSAEKSPDEPAIHYHLGLAYAKVGLTDEARQSLQRAVGMKRDFDGRATAEKMLAQMP